jgi:hypothetical protein
MSVKTLARTHDSGGWQGYVWLFKILLTDGELVSRPVPESAKLEAKPSQVVGLEILLTTDPAMKS